MKTKSSESAKVVRWATKTVIFVLLPLQRYTVYAYSRIFKRIYLNRDLLFRVPSRGLYEGHVVFDRRSSSIFSLMYINYRMPSEVEKEPMNNGKWPVESP